MTVNRSSPPTDDRQLLQHIASGDESALEALYDCHGPVVYATVFRMLKSVEHTEDLLQNIFSQIWNGGIRYDGTTDVRTWLLTLSEKHAVERLHARGLKDDEITELRKTAEHHTGAISGIHLPPELKDRILFAARLAEVAKGFYREQEKEAVAESNAEPVVHPRTTAEPASVRKPKKRPLLTSGLVIATVLMFVGFMMYIFLLLRSISSQKEDMRTTRDLIEHLETRNAALTRIADDHRATLEVLRSHSLETIALESTPLHPGVSGKIFFDPSSQQAIFNGAGLQPLTENDVYQFWIIRNQAPMSVGSFGLKTGEEAFHVFSSQSFAFDNLREITTMFVTRETGGEKSQPSSDVILTNKLPGR